MRVKTALAIALIMALLATPIAHAGFSAEYDKLLAEGMRLDVTAEIDKLPGFSEGVKAWLSSMTLTLMSSKTGASLALKAGDDALIAYGEETDLAFLRTGDKTEYFAIEPSATNVLSQDEAYAALDALYDALFAPIEEYKKDILTATTIKRVGAASSKAEYKLSKDQFSERWPAMRTALETALRLYLQHDSGALDDALALLDSLTFDSDAKLTRYLQKDGKTLGLKFEGTVSRAGSDARVAHIFFCVKQDTGANIILRLPAKEGKNDWKLVLTGDATTGKTQNKLNADISITRNFEGVKTSAEASAQMTCTTREGKETWKGTLKYEKTENNTKTAYTLKPVLTLENGTGAGEASLQVKRAGDTAFSGTLALAISREAPPAMQNIVETSGNEDTLAQTLTLAALRMLAELPPADAAALLHAVGYRQWLESDTVPGAAAPTETQGDNSDEWVVVDEEETK